MNIYDRMLKSIKEEISNDPFQIGYAGKTDKETADILNAPYAKMMSADVLFTPPINRILAGLEFAPNAVDDKVVKDAKLFIAIS